MTAPTRAWFLFDGTPVYNPAHLFGFFSTFNIDAAKDVQGNLLKGDKKERRLSYNIAGRHTYADVFTRLLNIANAGTPGYTPVPDYYFYDVNARIDCKLSDKDILFASIHYGRDHFKFDGSTFRSTFSWGNYNLQSGFDRFDFRLGSAVREYSIAQKAVWKAGAAHTVSFGISAGHTAFSVARFNISSTKREENLASGEELGEAVSLKASYPRMQQYKHLVASSGASLPTDIWYPSPARIRPEFSDQASLGTAWNFRDQVLVTGEGYCKWMRQLVDYKPGANLLASKTHQAVQSFFRTEF